MAKTNIWYVVGKVNKKSAFGYSSVMKRKDFFNTYDEANEHRIYLQPDYDDRLVVMKRTCQVL